MLTSNEFDSFADQIIALYSEYEESVICDIARRLGSLEMTSTAAWQMQRLVESGAVYENAIKELAKLTSKSETELKSIFQEAGVKAIRFDDSIYKKAGLQPVPLNLSPAMAQVLAAGLRKTNQIMRNMTMTTALSGQNAFVKAADLAYMQISTGAMSYNQAITDAVKRVAADGLSTIQYASGRTDQLDVAVRRTLLTGVSQTTGELQLTRADEMDCDLVQTSAHAGARPTHEIWQGRVFSRSGKTSGYPSFVESTGYGTAGGLCGVNCRHSFYPFFEGISENAYSEKARNELEARKVVYNGQEMSLYNATQYQRGIERKIRYWKRQASALQSAGKDNIYELSKLGEWQNRMRDFIKQTRLIREREREQVVGSGRLYAVTKKTTNTTAADSPVSKALKISEGKSAEPLRETVKIIDSVHDDGRLPEIPMYVSTTDRYNGAFYSSNYGAVKIDISKVSDHPHLTSAHEIGHFLDFSAIGEVNKFSSVDGAISKGWRDAVENSQAFKQLEQIMETGIIKFGDETIHLTDLKYIEYLLFKEELWARSYAQYIVEKSGDSVMLNELKIAKGTNLLPVQWDEADFAPIKKEIDLLFEEMKWLK